MSRRNIFGKSLSKDFFIKIAVFSVGDGELQCKFLSSPVDNRNTSLQSKLEEFQQSLVK
jgi:hypothetical protein